MRVPLKCISHLRLCVSWHAPMCAPPTYVADLVTDVLHLLSVTFAELWQQTFPNGRDPWYCLSSGAVINMVHAYNARSFSAEPSQLTPPIAYDFARLYTNIPHTLLTTAFSALVHSCLNFKNARSIRVETTDPPPAKPDYPFTHQAFVSTRLPNRRYTQHADRKDTRYLSTEDFLHVFSMLLAATYIQFGPVLVRQMCGIPMGISPAPFIANLFLAWYEYGFLLQQFQPHLQPSAKAVVARFRYTRRFLDDLLSLNNPNLQHLL